MEKYTYQDWLDGQPYSLIDDLDIDVEDIKKIRSDKEAAYRNFIKNGYEFIKESIKGAYEESFLKEKYLEDMINRFEEDMIAMETNNDINPSAIAAGRIQILFTRFEVEMYLSTNSFIGYTSGNLDVNPKHNFLDEFLFEKTPTAYITRLHLVKWLKWLKVKEEQSYTEPTINISLNRQTNTLKFNDLEKKQRSLHSLSLGTAIGYIWKDSPEIELPALYKLMKGRFIHESTTLEHFTSNFTGQSIDSITPVKWHEDNASELLYFILQLEDTSNIEKSSKRTDYKKLTACFVKPDGSPFTVDFKSLKQSIHTNLSAEKQKAIDELIRNFA